MTPSFDQQLLNALNNISWQLHEINQKLDRLTLPSHSPDTPEPPDESDPKVAAINWFRAHFNESADGLFDDFLRMLPLHPNGNKLGIFLAQYCIDGFMDANSCCSTPCARHIKALVQLDRKINVEQLRRSISNSLRWEMQKYHNQRHSDLD